ncbi:MAG: type III-A CRISPR-associated RAMP protein Csm5 [Desulfonauticus sp.]|nr:type III-A CRISPR-associated RAMP protein Csm5 [Desulfonauticus sp.]
MTTYYTMTLEILTPVHIGTGEELDSLNYVLRKIGQDAFVFLIDASRWFADNAQNPDVANVLKDYNYLELRRILGYARDIEKYARARIPVRTSNLVDLYQEAMQGRRNENELRISLLPRNVVGDYPYLPGSSIKGAIRTAVGSVWAHQVTKTAERMCSDRDRRTQECFPSYNKVIFGRPECDVFKYLKISDGIVSKDSTEIVRPEEVSRNPEKTSPAKGYLEVIKGLCSGNQVKIKVRLSIGDFIDKDFKEKDRQGREFDFAQRKIRSFDLEQLISNLNNFYCPKFEQELEKFYSCSHLSHVAANLQPVQEKIKQMDSNQALLRLGHFSHVECVTWDKVRMPKGKRIGGSNVYGTTRTLANGQCPFGWVLLTFEKGYVLEDARYDSVSSISLEPEPEAVKRQEPAQKEITPKVDRVEQKLESLKSRLEAQAFANLVGTLPNIVTQEILNDEDEEFKELAKKIVISFIQEKGLAKKVKNKNWYQKLIQG